MQNGISIYPGLDNTLPENLALIETAAPLGIRRLFTSLHIPETDPTALKRDLGILLQAARAHRMEIISDVSPATRSLLGLREFSLSAFRMLGITTLRLDDGFTVEDIARLSHNTQHIRLQLNASTMTPRLLQSLLDAKADLTHIDALHNFYPRTGTGLSEETLVRKTNLLHKAGIRVGAFLPTQDGRRRSPLQDGLPTLEDHRTMATPLAARHLVALGIDSIFLADALPTERELQAIASLPDDRITLAIDLCTQDPAQKELLSRTFTARLDEARDAVRAQESRHLLTGSIAPEHTAARPRGTITIDNSDYGRYMGELEILKRNLPADPRVNVAAHLQKSDRFLLRYLSPGRKFSFSFPEKNDIIKRIERKGHEPS